MKVVEIILYLAVASLSAGCVTKHPGGRSDLWTTTSYAEDDVVYYGFGFRF